MFQFCENGGTLVPGDDFGGVFLESCVHGIGVRCLEENQIAVFAFDLEGSIVDSVFPGDPVEGTEGLAGNLNALHTFVLGCKLFHRHFSLGEFLGMTGVFHLLQELGKGFSEFLFGQLTAIQLLAVMKRTGKKLSELAAEMTVFPQVLINVRVSQMGKARYNNDIEIKKAIESVERELGDEGRVLVRVSGTEPLVRVMLEGKDSDKIKELGESVAQVIKERLV